MLLKPVEALRLTVVFSLNLALFVVIKTTPLAARVPYMAPDAASFKISTDCISEEANCAKTSEDTGTPSKTIRGWELLIVPTPLILILGVLPGVPELTNSTPDALPCKAMAALDAVEV